MIITTDTQPEDIAGILDRLCATYGIAPTRFGRTFFHDPRMILDLRAGRQPRPTKVAKINAAIRSIEQAGAVA